MDWTRDRERGKSLPLYRGPRDRGPERAWVSHSVNGFTSLATGRTPAIGGAAGRIFRVPKVRVTFTKEGTMPQTVAPVTDIEARSAERAAVADAAPIPDLLAGR